MSITTHTPSVDLTVEKQCAGLPDCHLHTKYSFDSKLDPDSHGREAEKLGLCAITITDHVEIVTPEMTLDEPETGGWTDDDVRGSYASAVAMRGKYRGVDVYAGVELGQATFDAAMAEHVLSLADHDFVLGSMHLMRDGKDYYFLDYHECDPYEIYEQYLKDIYALVEWGKFDSLAHLTYPLRYAIGRDRIEFDERRFDAQYDRIFKALAESGKALEINTSGVRRENGFMLPDERLVRRFRELGGRYITLGSDAHRDGHIGAGIGEGAEIARRAGFEGIAVFEKHQPKFAVRF